MKRFYFALLPPSWLAAMTAGGTNTRRRSELLRGQDRPLPSLSPALLHLHSSAVSTAKLIFQFLLCDIWLTEQRCRGRPSVGREVEQVEGGQKIRGEAVRRGGVGGGGGQRGEANSE